MVQIQTHGLLRLAAWSMSILLFVAVADADFVEPDDFAAGTDISNAFPGVTLSAVGSFTADDAVVALDPSSQSSFPFEASTGSLVIGNNGDIAAARHFFRDRGVLSLMVSFDMPVQSVSLDFIGASNGAPDIGMIEAFDVNGVSLGAVTSGPLALNEFASTTFTSEGGNDIAFFYADAANFNGLVGIDNLRFSAVPEPSSLSISGLLFLFAAGRMRRRQS